MTLFFLPAWKEFSFIFLKCHQVVSSDGIFESSELDCFALHFKEIFGI